MTRKRFEDILDMIKDGNMLYNNCVGSLETLLDRVSNELDEEEYQDFKIGLKDLILEDL